MTTISPDDPREDRLLRAVGVLREGGVVALPTETFYGLAADCTNVDAVARLNRIKRKAEDSPSLLLMADVGQSALVAQPPTELFHRLADMFWPGPLTLVVPALPGLSDRVSGGRRTVGLRVPGLALPRRIARLLGRPITGVSANLSGEPPGRTAMEVSRSFPEGVDLILDGGPAPGGRSSTILDLCANPPRVLREGAIPLAALDPLIELAGRV